MKLERSKNAVRNIKTGLLNKIVALAGPFAVRTVFIHTLGAEYLGVNSLFSSVLSVLSLTELGFSSAIVFSMYNAIANDDHDTINALLLYYKKIYRYIGFIILGIGLLLIPFLPSLVHDSYPTNINPIIVYLIFLGNTVISYYMYAYLGSLINAFQRNDVVDVIGMYLNIFMYIIQILLLLTVKNYYAYLSIIPMFTIISNIKTAIVAKKMFPQYKARGVLTSEIKADIKVKVSGLVIQKVCEVSRNSFDSIFISMFLGLTEIAIYNNYYYIMNAIIGFMAIATGATLAGVGNSVASETVEKNYCDMVRINFVYMWISGWCFICLLCLFQPFMKIWVGENLMFPISSVVLLCVYFYVLKMGDVRSIYVQSKGIWWQNRYRAIAESIANIVLNYILGKYFGVNGIIVATLISLFAINFCYGSTLIFKYYFVEQKVSNYFLQHGTYFLVTAIICGVTYYVCSIIPGALMGFLAKMCVCVLLPNILYLLLYRNTKIYQYSISWILPRVGINEKNIVWKLLLGRTTVNVK